MVRARRSLSAWVGLAAFAALTAVLLGNLLAQPIDRANTAMKAPGTADAANLQQLAEVVPSANDVLIAFAVPGGLSFLPADRARIVACRDQLLASPGVVACRALPAPDPGTALLAVGLAGGRTAEVARAVVATAEASAPDSAQVFAAGLPLVEDTLAALVAGERRTTVPLLAVVLFAAAWLLFRRLSLAAAALLPALLAIGWTDGLTAALGHPLDPVGALLDPVLLTIGVATSVHFVEAFGRARRRDHRPGAAAAAARAEQATPALLATATTMVGLLSMATSPVPAVVDFGIRGAFGVGLVHAFTFGLLPPWLARCPARAAGGRAGAAQLPDRAGRYVRGLWRMRVPALAAAAAVTAIAVAGLPRLRADNDPLAMLPRSERCRTDYEVLAARLGGVEVCHLLAPARSAATGPDRLLPFLARACADPGLAGPAGPVLRGAAGDLAVPLRLPPGGSAARTALFARLERDAQAVGLDGLVPAGPPVQIARDSAALLHGLLRSTALTLLMLGLSLAIGLRSWRLAVAGLLPNVLPCLWLYGGLALLDHPVSVATAMIACTMLGLVVDNTLHLLHHFRQLARGRPRRVALAAALQRTGRPLWVSSTLLAVGFAATTASSLPTTVEFGLLAGATIVLALLATAVLLPLLLLSWRGLDRARGAGA